MSSIGKAIQHVALASLAKIAGYSLDRVKDRWVAGAATGVGLAGVGANALLSALGFNAVAHSSGAVILTGAGGYISGTYGLASILALVTLPITLLFFMLCILVGAAIFVKPDLWRRK
ncbi:hypothetical protein [Paracoccus sanguinis]|uniref:hypothetical protein n=1 Tax=Paracoccus sanguinis TaxID=1545044 RepID=UPI0012E0480F|nr:hypothetical protein [Paracoccus sanguinis]